MQIDTIDLRLIKVFLAIVENGGFAGAQVELGLTASTLSVHLSNLEKRLGVVLCQRGRGGFRMTDKGRLVYERAKRLVLDMEDFRAEVGSLQDRLVGQISIGMADNIITDPRQPLSEAIRRFTARNGDVHVNLSVDRPASLTQMLLDDRLHIAIGAFPNKVSGVDYTHLYNEMHNLYCARGHAFYDLKDEELQETAVAKASLVGRGYDLGRDVRLIGAASHAATVENMEAQAMLILSGGYIGFLPDHFAQYWVERGELRVIKPDHYNQVTALYVAQREERKRTQTLDAFLEDLHTANTELAKAA